MYACLYTLSYLVYNTFLYYFNNDIILRKRFATVIYKYTVTGRYKELCICTHARMIRPFDGTG